MSDKQKTSSVSKQYWNFSPEVQSLLDSYIGQIGDINDLNYEGYTGDRLAGFTGDELQSFDIVRNLIGSTQQGIGASQNILDQVAQRGLNGFDQATLDQYMNPYTTNVMDAARDRQLQSFDIQRRNLNQQQGAIGAFGGSRSAIAESSMYDNFNRGLAESEANLLYQGYNDAQNRAMAGTQLAGQAGMNLANLASMNQQAGLMDASALSAQGGQQRTLDQMGLDIGYQDFLTEKAFPYEQVAWGANALSPLAQMTGTQVGTQNSTSKSGGGLGGAIQAAVGIGSMMMGIPGMGAMMGGMGAGLGGLMAGGSMMGQGYANTGGGFFNSMSNAYKGQQGFYGPGFKEGGQVTPPSPRDIADFENLLKAMGPEQAQILLGGAIADDPSDAAPLSGDDLLNWIQRSNSENMGLGGVAPGFANGGTVMQQLFGQNRLDNMSNAYGDAYMRAYDSLPKGAQNTLDWIGENPVDAFGYGVSAIPMVGPATGAAVKGISTLAKPVAGGIRALANSPRVLSILGGLGLVGANNADEIGANMDQIKADRAVAQEALASDPGAAMVDERMKAAQEMAVSQGQNPNDPMVLENMLARLDSGLVNDVNTPNYAGGLPVDANRQVDMSLPGFDFGDSNAPAADRATALISQFDARNGMIAPNQGATRIEQNPAAKKEEAEWDPSLFNFGAAVLSAKGGLMNAIGEGGKAYSATKRQNKLDVIAKEDAIRDRARQAIKDQIEMAQLDISRQNAGANMMNAQTNAAQAPYRAQLNQLRAQGIQRELSQMSTAEQNTFNTLQKANEIALMIASQKGPEAVAELTAQLMGQAKMMANNGGLTTGVNSGTMGTSQSVADKAAARGLRPAN